MSHIQVVVETQWTVLPVGLWFTPDVHLPDDSINAAAQSGGTDVCVCVFFIFYFMCHCTLTLCLCLCGYLWILTSSIFGPPQAISTSMKSQLLQDCSLPDYSQHCSFVLQDCTGPIKTLTSIYPTINRYAHTSQLWRLITLIMVLGEKKRYIYGYILISGRLQIKFNFLTFKYHSLMSIAIEKSNVLLLKYFCVNPLLEMYCVWCLI